MASKATFQAIQPQILPIQRCSIHNKGMLILIFVSFDVLCDHCLPTHLDSLMGPDWRDGHGVYFRRVITAVDKRLQKYFNLRAIASWEPYKLEQCGNSKAFHLGR